MINTKAIKLFALAGMLIPAGLFSSSAHADQVILDDLIVGGGSLCVGQDCVNGESFGFDTLRLKENNLRIHFQDTSSSASFPSNDWRIIINDSTNGGRNFFAIEDSNAGRMPFFIEAGAPANSLYVEDGGRVGFGTATPVVEAHITDGDTPTVRLEQDGSSGFTPQAFDIASNETNFFIRDVTNGSRLPFRIRPGAPTSAIDIASTGRVGFSEQSPDEAIHITNVADSNGFIGVRYEKTGTDEAVWRSVLDPDDDRFLITKSGTGTSEMIISGATGDVTIRGGLISTGGGGACTVADPCDRVFDPSVYTVPSIEEHAKAMWENKFLPSVGPTKPDEPLNVTFKMTRMLNELEKAHIYIEQLNDRIKVLEQKLENGDVADGQENLPSAG